MDNGVAMTLGPLRARTPTGLVLDLGEHRAEAGAEIVEPSATPLYDQLIAWLDARKPAPPWKPRDVRRLSGVATTLVCVRWSTWLARLCDPALPMWEHAGDACVSAIDDREMARMNIEASYALERWIELLRTDREHWETLAAKALHYLPLAGRRVAPARTTPILVALHPEMPAVIRGWRAEHPGDVRPLGDRATRVFANAATVLAYRNGPIEDVHAGRDEGVPFDVRRVTPADEAAIMEFSGRELAVAIRLVETLVASGAVWEEAMVPYSLPIPAWSGADEWSVEEWSRRIVVQTS